MGGVRDDAPLNAGDDKEQRKERGRLAQRAFRQRQIDTIARLGASNDAMQAAIASLTRVAAQLENPELSEAVRNALNAAGLEAMPTSSSSGEGPAETTAAGEPPSPAPQSSLGAGMGSQALIPVEAHPPKRMAEPQQLEEASPQNPGYRTGRMSPRLGYGGLFLEPPTLHVVYPPPDIFPYLQTSRTLSTVLFWAGLSWGFKVLRLALGGNVDAMAMAWQIFGTFPPFKPDRKLLDGIHARLVFRMTGTIANDHPGYKADAAARRPSTVDTICEANGASVEDFLSPLAIEEALMKMLGDSYSLVDRGLRGLGPPENIATVRNLVDMMVKKGVCLGDGPRWRVDTAASLLNAWTREAGVA